MNRWLAHHGILGQKWGIRRYQNEDGTWTETGKKRRNFRAVKKTYSKSADEANDIFRTWTNKEKVNFDAEETDDEWVDQKWIDSPYMRYFNVTSIKNIPVSFFGIGSTTNKNIDATMVGVRNDPRYRQVGAAYEEGKKAVKYWFENNGGDKLEWAALEENPGSWKTAEKVGFAYEESFKDSKERTWKLYSLYRDKGEQWLKANGFK